MKLFRFSIRLACFACILSLSGRSALAHAIVLGSTPAPEATIASEELTIEIRFNSRIDAHRSHMKLFKIDGDAVGLPVLDSGSLDTLKAKARALTPGRYRLHWQTLSPDGHITQGDIPFAVSR